MGVAFHRKILGKAVAILSSMFQLAYLQRKTTCGMIEYLNLSYYNGYLWGTMFWPYTEVAFVERLICTQTVHLGPGRYITAGLYSEVVVNRLLTLT